MPLALREIYLAHIVPSRWVVLAGAVPFFSTVASTHYARDYPRQHLRTQHLPFLCTFPRYQWNIRGCYQATVWRSSWPCASLSVPGEPEPILLFDCRTRILQESLTNPRQHRKSSSHLKTFGVIGDRAYNQQRLLSLLRRQ
jgi:hypothetical protein